MSLSGIYDSLRHSLSVSTATGKDAAVMQALRPSDRGRPDRADMSLPGVPGRDEPGAPVRHGLVSQWREWAALLAAAGPGDPGRPERLAAQLPLFPSSVPEPGDVLEARLAGLWARTSPELAPADRARFAGSVLALARETPGAPGSAPSVEARRDSGSVRFATSLAELAAGASLPLPVRSSGPGRTLMIAFADLVTLASDTSDSALAATLAGAPASIPAAGSPAETLAGERRREFDRAAGQLPGLLDSLDATDQRRGTVEAVVRSLREATAPVAREQEEPGTTPDAEGGEVAPPPGFPEGVPLEKRDFRNWSGEIEVPGVWTASPASAADVVRLADWAKAHGWRLRAVGRSRTWAPLVLAASDADRTVLVDLTAGLTAVRVDPGAGTVTAQAGVELETLLTELERAGATLSGYPAIGAITLGGALATGTHGTGTATGTLAGLVRELTAVAWDAGREGYALRTFGPGDPEFGALLVNLGRALVVEATLETVEDTPMRARSLDHIPPARLFAAPEDAGPDSYAAWVERAGRVDVNWLPFTTSAWTKVFTAEPIRPPTARQVNGPYNYPFTDTLPDPAAELLTRAQAGARDLTPAIQNAQSAAISAGLTATASRDIWGWSKNVMLYTRPTGVRTTAGGWALLVDRSGLQQAFHDISGFLSAALAEHARQGRYPLTGVVGFRVTGTDGEQIPLSPACSKPGRDTVIWLNLTTAPGLSDSAAFLAECERWLRATFETVRPEWSKGWGYGPSGAYTDADRLPASELRGLDPHGVFSNDFLDTLLSRAAR
jgi:FAD/FMN-containing dehydrogenase